MITQYSESLSSSLLFVLVYWWTNSIRRVVVNPQDNIHRQRLIKWGGDLAFLAIILPIFLLNEFVGIRDEMFLPHLFVLPMGIVLYYTSWNQCFIASIVSAPGLCNLLGRYAWGIYILQEPLYYSLCSMVTGNGELKCFANDDKVEGWAPCETNNCVAVFLLLNIVSGLWLQWEVPLYKFVKAKLEDKLDLSKDDDTNKIEDIWKI